MRRALIVLAAAVLAACGDGGGDLRVDLVDFLGTTVGSGDPECVADAMLDAGLTRPQFDEAVGYDGTGAEPFAVLLYQDAIYVCGLDPASRFESVQESL